MVSFELPRRIAADIPLPTLVARRLCERAEEEWGTDTLAEVAPGITQVSLWLGGRSRSISQRLGRPPGAFLIRWDYPTHGEAMITHLHWDPASGGSEEEVRQVINVLLGWPAANLPKPVRPATTVNPPRRQTLFRHRRR